MSAPTNWRARVWPLSKGKRRRRFPQIKRIPPQRPPSRRGGRGVPRKAIDRLKLLQNMCCAGNVYTRLGFDVQRGHLAVFHHHGKPLGALAHRVPGKVCFQPERTDEIAISVREIKDLAFAARKSRPRS